MNIQNYSSLNKKILSCLVILVGATLLSPLIAVGGEVDDVAPPEDVIPPEPSPQPTVSPVLSLVFILCMNFVINLLVLSVTYLTIKRRKLILSFKFLRYTALVTLGGIFIDLIFVAGSFFGEPYSPGLIFIGSVFLTFLGLVVYNYWLSRKFFQLSKGKALLVGMVMGVITHPLWFYLYFAAASEVVLK